MEEEKNIKKEKITSVDINSFIEESKRVSKDLESVMEHFKLFLDKNNYKNRDNYLEIVRDIEKICENEEMLKTYKYLEY